MGICCWTRKQVAAVTENKNTIEKSPENDKILEVVLEKESKTSYNLDSNQSFEKKETLDQSFPQDQPRKKNKTVSVSLKKI